jgi:hypothetical protein
MRFRRLLFRAVAEEAFYALAGGMALLFIGVFICSLLMLPPAFVSWLGLWRPLPSLSGGNISQWMSNEGAFVVMALAGLPHAARVLFRGESRDCAAELRWMLGGAFTSGTVCAFAGALSGVALLLVLQILSPSTLFLRAPQNALLAYFLGGAAGYWPGALLGALYPRRVRRLKGRALWPLRRSAFRRRRRLIEEHRAAQATKETA